jgi:hypothetical protein
MWTMRPCVIGGQTAPGDFVVLRRGQEVGRVVPAPHIPGTLPYDWSTWTYPADNGKANDIEDALSQLRTAIRRRWPDNEKRVPLAGTRRG